MADEKKELPVSASDWNAMIAEAAKAAGKTPEEFVAAKPEEREPIKQEEKQDEITVYRQTVRIGGRDIPFEGASPEEVLLQVTAAINSQPEPVKVEEKKPEPKKELSKDQLFEIGLKLQQGDVTALSEYIEKTDLIGEYLKKQGVDVADVKKVLNQNTTTEAQRQVESTVQQWLKQESNDYPGGPQNEKMMKYRLAEQGLTNPSVEDLSKTWSAIKADGMAFAVQQKTETEQPVKKKAAGSSAFGTDATASTRQVKVETVSITRAELAAMSGRQVADFYNDAISRGVKPEAIVVTQ